MSSPPTIPDALPPNKSELPYVLRLWFGVSEPVRRQAYLLSGLALMGLKYAVEASVVWLYTSRFFWPWDFLNPTMEPRLDLLRPAPEWLPWAWFVWTLPFLWIAVSMSVRRVADTGKLPWWGLMVLIPIVNLVFMLVMCFVPSQSGEQWSLQRRATSSEARARSAVFAVAASLMIGGLMLWISVYVFATYGASLFLGTPFLMSATAAYLYNRPHPRGFGESAGLGLVCIGFAALALLLFGLEGLFCVLMAAPLMLPIGALGGVLGKAIADSTRRPARELLAGVVLLPLLAGGESFLLRAQESMVLTTIEVNASPAKVWDNVVSFPELTESKQWYFAWGIACPESARIEGRGPGAVRYCEFTTGTFVEPITAWEPPLRLAFDVAQQPAPMTELSPYQDLDAPHLHGYLRSTHGEFRLIPLADGRTRLEGRTWYEFNMFPQWYWMMWSDQIIHRIHQRVLTHIKNISEVPPASRE